jgi:TolB-like protein
MAMKQGNAGSGGATAGEAARRFVRVDSGERGAEAELAAWLDDRPENEPALERVELAVALGKRLAADPGSALYAEAAAAARAAPRRRTIGGALAWGGALAAAVLLAVLVVPDSPPRSGPPELAPLPTAWSVSVDAPTNAVAVLPSGAVVDASAVAVLPFATAGDAALAAGLERDVAASLRTVPGLYVIADAAVAPYAATQLDAAEIGNQLGARGLVDAAVELVDGRVRVSARLREAATGATLWEADLDRPVDELGAVRYEIAESVAATMLDSSLREQVARTAQSSAPNSFSKPLPQ